MVMIERSAGLGIALMLLAIGEVAHGEVTKLKPFTTVDEIALTLFKDPNGEIAFYGRQLQSSPDGKYLAVWAERGRLDPSRLEDSLRFYRSEDIRNLLQHPQRSRPPSPVWVVTDSSEKGPVIQRWRWLA